MTKNLDFEHFMFFIVWGVNILKKKTTKLAWTIESSRHF